MFRKKKKEVKPDYDVVFLKQVLRDLNLLDVENLIGMATIQADKNARENLVNIMKILEPSILEAVKNGKTHGNSEWFQIEDYSNVPYGIGHLQHKLADLGYNISYELNYDSTYNVNNPNLAPSEKKYRYNFSLYKPRKDDNS